ncbi:MAG: GNAT family N-acetyltransferase [Bacteroidales bacterium]|nr:GNAT family N-acetyltransferase [Bacteroidales bacterium]
MEFKTLTSMSAGALIDVFMQAFADYAVTFDPARLQDLFTRRGFVADLSMGAFDGDRLCAFTFNGIGTFRGVRTAYDTGTGTLPEYRGRKLAPQIFEASLPLLHQAGVEQYVLEVLQDNEPAIRVYRNQGFEITRSFNCYSAPVTDLRTDGATEITISPIGQGQIEACSVFLDFEPSWQNSFESLRRGAASLLRFGAFHGDRCVGYVVSDPLTGDVSQIAVAPDCRRRGIGTALLRHAARANRIPTMKILNLEPESTADLFARAAGFTPGAKQFEMLRPLS